MLSDTHPTGLSVQERLVPPKPVMVGILGYSKYMMFLKGSLLWEKSLAPR